MNKEQIQIIKKQVEHSGTYLEKQIGESDAIVKNAFRATKHVESDFWVNSIDFCLKYKVMPVKKEDNIVSIMISPDAIFDNDEICRLAKREFGVQDVNVALSDNLKVHQFINSLKEKKDKFSELLSSYLDSFVNNVHSNQKGLQLASLLQSLIEDALTQGASDIHIDYKKEDPFNTWISYRIKGFSRKMYLLTSEAASALMVRIKDKAKMDIAENTIEMDGKFRVEMVGKTIDIRVAYLPLANGEKLTLRLLDPTSVKGIKEIFHDFPEWSNRLHDFCQVSKSAKGIVLVGGVTGSGKTSSLLGMIKSMPRERLNIMTAEDPVEYEIPLTNPIQVTKQMPFPRVLRSMLRHDPDAILLGEMRDSETAETSLRIADSGHMLFTTIHAGDPISSINRLRSMLPDNYRKIGEKSISSNLRLVINQSLVEQVCPYCGKTHGKRDESIEKLEKFLGMSLDEESVLVEDYNGCSMCSYTGIYQRQLLPEILMFNGNRKESIEHEKAILNENVTWDEITSLPGVYSLSIEESIHHLLMTKKIGLLTALRVVTG